jgi:peptidoglycan/LPS O-acetylase OafA/YrhL
MSLQEKTLLEKYTPIILPACLIIGITFLTTGNVFSQSAADETSSTVYGITAGRSRSLIGGVIALISVILGWRAKATSTRNNNNKKTQAIIALSLGAIAIVLSVIHLGKSAGAVFGSGSGKAGAIVALVLALIGVTLSGLALRRKRENQSV